MTERPLCPTHGLRMWSKGFRDGRRHLRCLLPHPRDWNGPVVLTSRELLTSEPDRLLDLITRQLPGHLPPDAREDARQEIVLAVLEGHDLDRRAIRHIAAEARGMTQNRYRFLSLDAPILGTDGLTRAETLIG